ncbi:MAG: sugar phosphate isomerase/epimerase family protein [Bacteroidales bacterium]
MTKSLFSRRKFLGTAATAAALAATPFHFAYSKSSFNRLPNSKVGGIQLGCTTYSYRSMSMMQDDIIDYLLLAGINSIELRSVAEETLGLPPNAARPPRGAELSEKEKADFARAAEASREAQRKWRLSLPMQKYRDMRNKFNSAGIDVHISKFAPTSWSDEEIDYAFRAAQVLGSKGISDEIGNESAARLGKFAEKHSSLAILHNHAQPAEPGFSFDDFLDKSPANTLNFDAGHYYGATGLHPNEIIEKYHTRMTSIHIKDKTGPKSSPANTNKAFGEGETPIADILLLLKGKNWPIHVDIELEYPVPANSNAAKEVARSIEYMRNILE